MRMAKILFSVAALALLFGVVAKAQNIEGNRLCMHNGGDYYYKNPGHGFPNTGGAKYFPSFAHYASTPNDQGAYPWKILGWTWTGMQGLDHGPYWYWKSVLQKSLDNPYSPRMSFDYPVLYATGQVPSTGWPMPIYGAITQYIPELAGVMFYCPSSLGGFDKYMNVFAVGAASWVIPSAKPLYSWDFGFIIPAASAVTIPSGYSIWSYIWENNGDWKKFSNQYLILSGDETDCLGGLGNKGRCYSMTLWPDGSFGVYWENTGSGVGKEYAMCLLVGDAVTIPVNIPGAPSATNPFAAYGFDVGVATVTPLLSSGNLQLGFMTEDGWGLGGDRVVLAAFAQGPCVGPYGKYQYRIPHGWDLLTTLFLNMASYFLHTPQPGYPAAMFGTTTGAHSAFVSLPAHAVLINQEVRFSTYAANPGMPMSASYMMTFF